MAAARQAEEPTEQVPSGADARATAVVATAEVVTASAPLAAGVLARDLQEEPETQVLAARREAAELSSGAERRQIQSRRKWRRKGTAQRRSCLQAVAARAAGRGLVTLAAARAVAAKASSMEVAVVAGVAMARALGVEE